jgi:heme/copper-type cytochrome/quinol oxidase subunit 2
MIFGVVSGIFVLLIIGGIGICCFKYRKKKNTQSNREKYQNNENIMMSVGKRIM